MIYRTEYWLEDQEQYDTSLKSTCFFLACIAWILIQKSKGTALQHLVGKPEPMIFIQLFDPSPYRHEAYVATVKALDLYVLK
jgi:hypothetical protein